MIMGSDAGVREPEPIESPIRNTLEEMRKGGISFAGWLMIGLWSALCHVVLLPMKFVQARHDTQRDLGYRVEEPRLPTIPFTDWPPALRRARMGLEKRYRAFLAVNEREEKERQKRTQASTVGHWMMRKKGICNSGTSGPRRRRKPKGSGNPSATAGAPREWLPSPRRDGESSGGEAPTPIKRRRTLQLRADRGSVSPRADLEDINSERHEEKEEIPTPPTT